MVSIGNLIATEKVGFGGGETVKADLERVFLEQLRQNHQFAGVIVGRPDGSFFFTTRDVSAGGAAYRT